MTRVKWLQTSEMPLATSELKFIEETLIDGQAAARVLLDTVSGAGILEAFQIRFQQTVGTVDDSDMILYIIIDGTTFTIELQELNLSLLNTSKTVSPFSITFYDATLNDYGFAINFPIFFQQSLKITAFNNATAGNKFTVQSWLSYRLVT